MCLARTALANRMPRPQLPNQLKIHHFSTRDRMLPGGQCRKTAPIELSPFCILDQLGLRRGSTGRPTRQGSSGRNPGTSHREICFVMMSRTPRRKQHAGRGVLSGSNTIVRHQAWSNRNRTACATDPRSCRRWPTGPATRELSSRTHRPSRILCQRRQSTIPFGRQRLRLGRELALSGRAFRWFAP